MGPPGCSNASRHFYICLGPGWHWGGAGPLDLRMISLLLEGLEKLGFGQVR